MRWLKPGLGLVVMVLGVACLNYTNGFGIEHHAQWAAEHSAPAPSYGIFVMGAAATALGAGFLGFSLGLGLANRSASCLTI